MSDARVHKSFRFTNQTVMRLNALSRYNRESMNQTVERLIGVEYSRLFYPLMPATQIEGVPHAVEKQEGAKK